MTIFVTSSATLLLILGATICSSQHFDGEIRDIEYLDKIQAQLRKETMTAHHVLVNQTKILQNVTRNYIEARVRENLFKAVRARVEQELDEIARNNTSTPSSTRQARQEADEEDEEERETEDPSRARPGILPQLANVVTTFFGQDVNVTSYVKDATSYLPPYLSNRLVNAASLVDPNRFTSTTTAPAPQAGLPPAPLIINGQIVPQGMFANGSAFSFGLGGQPGVFQQHNSFDFRKVTEAAASGGAVVPQVSSVNPQNQSNASVLAQKGPFESIVVDAPAQPHVVVSQHPNYDLIQQSNFNQAGSAAALPVSVSSGSAPQANLVPALPPPLPKPVQTTAPVVSSPSQIGPRPVYVAQAPSFGVATGPVTALQEPEPPVPLPMLPALPHLPVHAGIILDPIAIASTLFAVPTTTTPSSKEEESKVDHSDEEYDLFARDDLEEPTNKSTTTTTPAPANPYFEEYPAIRYAVRIFQRLTRTESPPTTTEFMNTTTVPTTTPDYIDDDEPLPSTATPMPGTLMRIVNVGLNVFEGAREAYQLLQQVNRFLDRVNDRFENAGYGADTVGIEV